MHDGMPPGFGLGEGADLLIRTLRRIAAGNADGALVRREFMAVCGEEGVEVFATFCTFLQAAAYASRRTRRIGHPGSPLLTPDEVQLLEIIAAAHRGDDARLAAHLLWLVRPPLRGWVALTARAVAAALAAVGHPLPERIGHRVTATMPPPPAAGAEAGA